MRHQFAITSLFIVALVVGVPNAIGGDFSGNELLIPVAARTPGLQGTEWRTDLVISNPSENEAQVTVRFLQGGALLGLIETTLPRMSTVRFEDVIFREFGMEQGVGIINIHSAASLGTSSVSARARVYSVAPGESDRGQTMQAMNVRSLARDSFLSGLTNARGFRTNAGIANPDPEPAIVWLAFYGDDGSKLHDFWTEIGAFSVVPITNVIGHFSNGEFENATLRIAGDPVYAYASILPPRGDAEFLIATAGQAFEGVSEPACSNPAPLHSPTSYPPVVSDGWLIGLHPATDPWLEMVALREKYGIREHPVLFESSATFVADVSGYTVAQIRCEPSVAWVQLNVRY